MKGTSLVVEFTIARTARAFLARAERTKILARTRTQVVEELENNSSHRLVVEFNIEKTSCTRHRRLAAGRSRRVRIDRVAECGRRRADQFGRHATGRKLSSFFFS